MAVPGSRLSVGFRIDLRFLSDGEPAYGCTRLTVPTLVPEVSLDQMLLKGPLRKVVLRKALSEGSCTVIGHISPLGSVNSTHLVFLILRQVLRCRSYMFEQASPSFLCDKIDNFRITRRKV